MIFCNPPKNTSQGSLTVLRSKKGKLFIGKKSGSKAKQTVSFFLDILKPYVPQKPLVRPLKAEIRWVYPFRKCEHKNISGYKYCDKRPDIDNLLKLFLDCMTKSGFWVDDAQVADLRFVKLWGEMPYISVYLEELPIDTFFID